MILLLLSCTGAAPPAETTAAGPAYDEPWADVATLDANLVPLDAPRLLRRLSIDLRGRLPTTAELDAVEADPEALPGIRDAYLDDPAFEERFAGLLGERLLTELDEFLIQYLEFPGVAEHRENEYPWERAVGQEAPRLMAHIVANDRPWSEVVTADYTMADEYLGATWPVDYPAGETGWREVHYTDDRPPVGILATNGLWWRYYSTFTNYNRSRAAALSRILLCSDFLTRPIDLGISLDTNDPTAMETAVRTEPACLGCHAAIDPLAASLFGFWSAQTYSGIETTVYHPERELVGEALMQVDAAWFGQPVQGLAEIGPQIAADPRFARCAAQTAAEVYWHRKVTIDDFERVEALRQIYLEGGGQLKPVLAAVTDTAVYRAGGVGPEATAEQVENERTTRLLHLRPYASVVEGLTGFTWTHEGYDLLDSDTLGFRTLGGGVDGDYVSSPLDGPGLTWDEVVRRVAEGAGSLAGQQVGVSGLLATVNPADRPGSPGWDDAVATLRWRLFAVRPADADLAGDAALWSTVEAVYGPQTAWAALVTAWLREPAFVGY